MTRPATANVLVQWKVLLLALASLAASGCASTGNLVSEPVVELASVEVESISATRQSFLLGFSVYNPNAFPLPVEGLRYRIRLNDQKFAEGRTRGRFNIPADGNGSFQVSVDLDLMRSGSQLATLIRTGLRDDMHYQLYGNLDLELPTSPSLAFSSAGTIAIQVARR